MQYKTFQLKDILERQPKSRRKAGDGLTAGAYPFFTSSPVQSKWLDGADYDKPSVILGTGGGPSVHFATQFSTSTDVFVFSSKNADVLAEYIRYYLSAHIDLLERGFKGAGLKHISSEYVQKLPIRLPICKDGTPDKSEQERIVALLQEAEALKEKRALANQKMTEAIPALFVKMFGGRNSYPLVPLGEVAEVGYGRADKIDRSITPENGVILIRIGNVRLNGTLDLQDKVYTPKTPGYQVELLKKGDLLFNWRNGSAEHVGKTVLFEENGEYINASFLIRIQPDRENVNSRWLWQYLNTLRSSGFFITRARMQVNSKINASELKAFKIPLPSIEEQNAFDEKVKDILTFENRQDESTALVEKLYLSLLSKAFV